MKYRLLRQIADCGSPKRALGTTTFGDEWSSGIAEG